MKSSLLLLCLVCAPPGMAAEPLEGVLACRAVTDSAARLACFDRETAALERAPASSAAPQPAATVLDAQQSFGVIGSPMAASEGTAGARPAELAKLEGHIVALALTGKGRTLFTLDNTQVWRQLESDGDVLAKLGDSATISRGVLGSYWLQLKSGRGCKVTRVR